MRSTLQVRGDMLLNDSCIQGTYSLPASLALLRTYVTQPDKADIKLLSDLLVKAMMQLPNSDFATVLHLIPERLQARGKTLLPWTQDFALCHMIIFLSCGFLDNTLAEFWSAGPRYRVFQSMTC